MDILDEKGKGKLARIVPFQHCHSTQQKEGRLSLGTLSFAGKILDI